MLGGGTMSLFDLTLSDRISIQASPEKVWAVFGDVRSWPKWNGVCLKVDRLVGKPWTVGFTFLFLPSDRGTVVVDEKRFTSRALPVRLFYPRPVITSMSRQWLRSLRAEVERRGRG